MVVVEAGERVGKAKIEMARSFRLLHSDPAYQIRVPPNNYKYGTFCRGTNVQRPCVFLSLYLLLLIVLDSALQNDRRVFKKIGQLFFYLHRDIDCKQLDLASDRGTLKTVLPALSMTHRPAAHSLTFDLRQILGLKSLSVCHNVNRKKNVQFF